MCFQWISTRVCPRRKNLANLLELRPRIHWTLLTASCRLQRFSTLTFHAIMLTFAVDSPDFKAGVASLASLLQIPPHNDHHIVLKVTHNFHVI